MAQLARGLAVEDPIAVFSACQRPGMRQFPERCRDGRPVGADEICEPLVGERERNYNAVRMHSAPALGEVPEDQHEPVVDALVVGDSQRDGEGMGASSGAVEELDTELRPGRDPRYESLIEDGHACRLEHRPADLGVHV